MVMIHLRIPKDKFYDFAVLAPIVSIGQNVMITDVNFTTIPLHIHGGVGVVFPLCTTDSERMYTQAATAKFSHSHRAYRSIQLYLSHQIVVHLSR